jgi:hypothetical protein
MRLAIITFTIFILPNRTKQSDVCESKVKIPPATIKTKAHYCDEKCWSPDSMNACDQNNAVHTTAVYPV